MASYLRFLQIYKQALPRNSRLGFLNFFTIDILVQIILCRWGLSCALSEV